MHIRLIRKQIKGLWPVFIFTLMISIFPLLPSRAVDTIFSPDGRIILNCDLRVHEAPYPSGLQFYFNVQFNSFTVIKDSPLGLSLEGRPPLLGDWRLYDQQVRTHTESFRDCFGKRKLVTITWKEAVFSLQEKRPPFRLLKVHFRVSNDGIAFRYEIPAQQIDLPLRLTAEETQIFLPRDYTSYALRRSSFTSTYQRQYTVGQISKWIPDSLVALPLLMQDGENHWLAFAEAELRDCGGLNLLPGNEYGEISLHAALAPLPGDSAVVSIARLPYKTPWRVILIADQAAELLESDFITALNAPSMLTEADWVKPGLCLDSGWLSQNSRSALPSAGISTDSLLMRVHFAAGNGIPYVLAGPGWNGNTNTGAADVNSSGSGIDIDAVLKAAREEGVGIFLWLESSRLRDRMEEFFSLYQTWGVSGLVIHLPAAEDQEAVRFKRLLAENSARHKLMIVFHGGYKPTGMRRTYPHILSEGASLSSAETEGGGHADPMHDLILPFTRMLAGPLDAAGGCFRPVNRSSYDPDIYPPVVQGTRTHQLAMYLVYDSPLARLADFPSAYTKGEGFDLLKNLPTVWDSTAVLQGRPGDYIIILRKKGEELYVGGLNGWQPREIALHLDFLQSGKFQAEIWQDGPNTTLKPSEIVHRKVPVDSGTTLPLALAAGGGYIARFSPLSSEE